MIIQLVFDQALEPVRDCRAAIAYAVVAAKTSVKDTVDIAGLNHMNFKITQHSAGNVAVEFALLLPMLVLLVIGAIDLGNYLHSFQSLAAAARVGGEYARNSSTCQAGNQPVFNEISSDCSTGIQNAMQNSENFDPPLSFPKNFSVACYCDDGSPITCGDNSCVNAKLPPPNRVFIRINAGQTVKSWWPGFPTSTSGSFDIRIQ